MAKIPTNMLDCSRIEHRLQQNPHWLAAYLLGSAADGTMRRDSDVDIAILPMAGCRPSQGEVFELASELTMIIECPVDIGLLSSQNLVYASEALLKGHRFYCQDTAKADLAAATLLGLAMAFNIERKEIIDAYTA
jgi:predicted nucleotidyltransferase